MTQICVALATGERVGGAEKMSAPAHLSIVILYWGLGKILDRFSFEEHLVSFSTQSVVLIVLPSVPFCANGPFTILQRGLHPIRKRN
jgi:hypothetical protein